MTTFSTIMDFIVDNLLFPLILIAATTLLAVAGSYVKKISTSIIAKNESELLKIQATIKSEIISQLEVIVDSAVATNMGFAENLKKQSDGHLTTDEANQLKDAAAKMIMSILPDSLANGEGELNKIIGGEEKLNILIGNLIEKYVIEEKYKLTKS